MNRSLSLPLLAAAAWLVEPPSASCAQATPPVVWLGDAMDAGPIHVSPAALPPRRLELAPIDRPAARALPLGVPIKLSGPMVPGGDLLEFLVSSDGERVVYLADQDVDQQEDLYSVAVTGGPWVALEHQDVITAHGISPDGATVVYVAHESLRGDRNLYSVPIGGGPWTQLSGPLPPGSAVITSNFAISHDSTRVVYQGEQETPGLFELFSVPIGGGPYTKLNGPLVTGGDVYPLGYAITTDDSRVIYRADQVTNDVNELFSSPITGGGSTKLNPTLVPGGDVADDFLTTVGGRTYYIADQDTDGVNELYSVPNEGGPVVKLNGPLVAGGNVVSVSIGVERVVYRADQDANDVFEAYSVPATGGVPVKLNPPLVVGGDVTHVVIPDNDVTALYRADQDADEVFELYSVPATGGVATQLNGALVAGGDVSSFVYLYEPPWPSLAAYRADQETDGVSEIYSLPLSGGAPTKINGPILAGAGVTIAGLTATGIFAYVADAETAGTFELYGGTTTGVGPVTALNLPLGPGQDVTDVAFSGIFPLPTSVVYIADQDTGGVNELYSVFLDGDADDDQVADGSDCLAYDPAVWALPGEVTALLLVHTRGEGGTTTLSWTAPGSLGGAAVVYDVVRSTTPSDFVNGATCLETDDGADTSAADTATPALGEVFSYLVRAEHTCGAGTLGTDSSGTPRTARTCLP